MIIDNVTVGLSIDILTVVCRSQGHKDAQKQEAQKCHCERNTEKEKKLEIEDSLFWVRQFHRFEPCCIFLFERYETLAIPASRPAYLYSTDTSSASIGLGSYQLLHKQKHFVQIVWFSAIFSDAPNG